MTVISDTSPLSVLAEIGKLSLLQQLFGTIILPLEVLQECLHEGAPEALRQWASALPSWVVTAFPPLSIPSAAVGLDPGESAAIALAVEASGPVLLLMAERAGVAVARRLGLAFTGTLGLLVRGHHTGLIDFETSIVVHSSRIAGLEARLPHRLEACATPQICRNAPIAQLRGTRFRFTGSLIDHARRMLA